MTKIDVFMHDLSTIIEEWRNLPLGRDTPSYYRKIIEYIKEHIEGLENEYIEHLIKKYEGRK